MTIANILDCIKQVTLGRPMVSERDRTTKERRIYPSEGRERLTTYRSKLTAHLEWTLHKANGQLERFPEVRECGLLPVMVRVSHHILTLHQYQADK